MHQMTLYSQFDYLYRIEKRTVWFIDRDFLPRNSQKRLKMNFFSNIYICGKFQYFFYILRAHFSVTIVPYMFLTIHSCI